MSTGDVENNMETMWEGYDLNKHIVEFFSDLYSEEAEFSMMRLSETPVGIRKLDDSCLSTILSIPSMEEIKEACWSLKPFKAPGTDGLHAGFFQRCWNKVTDNLTIAIKHLFSSSQISESCKKFLICLVPKVKNPEHLKLFRTISLGNTSYKIVTKIIASRLSSCLQNLINPVKAAFLPGSRAADNIVVVQEALNSDRNSLLKEGCMVIKIDLEKAFDRLEWGFIRERKRLFNLSRLEVVDLGCLLTLGSLIILLS